MNEKIQQWIKGNNKLLMLIPLLMGAFLFLLFFLFSREKKEESKEKETVSKFEPMSEEDTSVKDKITAYDRDKKEEERRRNLQLRGMDFYKNMRDREQEDYERYAVEKMQRGVGNSFYENDYTSDDESGNNPYYDEIENGGNNPRCSRRYSDRIAKNLEDTERAYQQQEIEDVIDEYVRRGEIKREQAEEIKKNKELYTQLGILPPEEKPASTSVPEPEPELEASSDPIEEKPFLIDASGKRQRRIKDVPDIRPNLIRACVHGNQTLLSGGTVRLRLLESIIVNGQEIPKNTIFYGTAGGGGTRLRITVENIRIGSYITSVSYIIYDNDAIEGLNIPNNLKAKAKKQAEQSLTSGIRLPLSSIGTITAEITSAINAVSQTTRQIIQSYLNLIRIDLKANYQLYIHEETKNERKAREQKEKEALRIYMKELEPKQENSLQTILDQLYNQNI